jgi:hypothetical protein
MKTPLQLLSQIEIASPCPVQWDAMHGDDHVRHCDQCDKQVYDISAMTAREAYEFLISQETSVCVQIYKRKDGTVLTADCPVGVRQRFHRRWRQAVALVASLFAFAFASGCNSGESNKDETTEISAMAPKTEKERCIVTGGVIPPPPANWNR